MKCHVIMWPKINYIMGKLDIIIKCSICFLRLKDQTRCLRSNLLLPLLSLLLSPQSSLSYWLSLWDSWVSSSTHGVSRFEGVLMLPNHWPSLASAFAWLHCLLQDILIFLSVISTTLSVFECLNFNILLNNSYHLSCHLSLGRGQINLDWIN